MDKTNLVVAFLIAAVVAGIVVQFMPVSAVPASKEAFMQQEIGMPLNAGGMGPYDGVAVGGQAGWATSEPMPVGTMPVNTPLDTNKLMLLVGNKTSADCCPSAYNTDTGCVCLTEQDRKLFASRGGNKL